MKNKTKENKPNHPSGTYVKPWSEVIGDSKPKSNGPFDGGIGIQVE